MKTKKLVELGQDDPKQERRYDKITFDIIFREKKNYELIKKSRVLTKKTVAKLFSIPEGRISDFVEFDPAYAVKFTIQRTHPSGSPGRPMCSDVSNTAAARPRDSRGDETTLSDPTRETHPSSAGRLRSSTSRTTLSKREDKKMKKTRLRSLFFIVLATLLLITHPLLPWPSRRSTSTWGAPLRHRPSTPGVSRRRMLSTRPMWPQRHRD